MQIFVTNFKLGVILRKVLGNLESYLGVFAKFRKVTISFVVSVCPSVRMEQLSSHWADFHEI